MYRIYTFFAYAAFAMTWKLSDIFINQIGFSPTKIALMTNAITIAKILGSFLVSICIFKLGNKKTFSISVFFLLSCLFIGFTKQFPIIFFIIFILGIGGAFILVTINPIVANYFSGKELIIVMD